MLPNHERGEHFYDASHHFSKEVSANVAILMNQRRRRAMLGLGQRNLDFSISDNKGKSKMEKRPFLKF